MPFISRVMIRLALIYLAGGILIGATMLANKATGIYPEIWRLLPVHIELMIFGWIIQFTLGTAYWMLPRLIKGEPRGNEKVALLIPVLLNLGIFVIITSYLYQSDWNLKLFGRISEAMVVPVFILLHWKRISKQIHDE